MTNLEEEFFRCTQNLSDCSTPELAVAHVKLNTVIQRLKAQKRCIETELCSRNECVDVTDASVCAQLGKHPFRVNVKQNTKFVPHTKTTLRTALLQYLQTTNPDNPAGLEVIADQAVHFVWTLRPSKKHLGLAYTALRLQTTGDQPNRGG